MGGAPRIRSRVPPRGHKRDFGCALGWSSNPDSGGNAKPERQTKTNLDDYDTNVDGRTEPNVNLGFGSKTVGSSSPPRAKNSISDCDVSGLASPVLGKRSRTEVETPSSKLAPSFFSRMDEGDSARGGGARSVFQDHVRVPNSSRTPSRYRRSSSRSKLKRSSPCRSHARLPSNIVMGAVDATGGMNARTPDRRCVGGLPEVSGGEQRVESRSSPADVQPHFDEDEQENQRELPKAGGAGVGVSDLNGSFPSDPGIRSSLPTAGALSSQMDVLSGSGISDDHGDQDAGRALRWKLRREGLNEMTAGKVEKCAGECRNQVDGFESMDGYRPNRTSSVVSVDDGLDDGEGFDCAGLGGGSYHMECFTRTDASQDQDAPYSRFSRFSYSTPGFCADADVETGSRGSPVGSCSTIHPRSRYRYSGLSSDRGSVSGSPLRRHVKDRTVGSALSPGSRSRPRTRRRTSIPGPFRTTTPSLPVAQLAQVPHIYDVHALQDNTDGNSSWLIQPQGNVHADTQEFDTLRFSSSSPSTSISGAALQSASGPSNLLLDDKDKPDETADIEAGSSGPGFIGHPPFNGELRNYMKTDMTPDSSTSTGLGGGTDGTQFKYVAPGRPLTSFINNRANDDGSVLRHVDEIEGRDMGGLEHESLGPLNHHGRASPLSGSVSGFVSHVSGVSAVGSLFHPAFGTKPHSDEEGTRSPASSDSRSVSVQSRSIDHGDGGEPEECGLLKSLLESSDPWGLMRKKVLNLPSPTSSDVKRRSKREEEQTVVMRGSLGRRGVGYVTPPSMGALLGEADLNEEVGMGEVEEGEDSQEILDFRSSQPRTAHFPLLVAGKSSR